MPTNQQIVIPAPTGINLTDESLETSANSAQQLSGFLCDRLGKIRSDINQVFACDLSLVAAEGNVEPASGLLYYIGQQVVSGCSFPNDGTNFLLALIGQSLYNAQHQVGSYVPSLTALVPFAPQYPYTFQNPVAITDGPNGNFLSNPSRIRGAQYANEMVVVQDGSITTNYRYYSICTNNNPFTSTTHLRTLGIATPVALVLGTTIVYQSPSGGHVARTGTPSYSYTLVDEFGRESSPAVPVQLDFTSTNAGDDALISFTYVNPAGYLAVAAINIYEYVTGNANAYLIYSQALTTGSNTITYEDGPTGTTDTTIEQGPVGPTPGENDPPNPASICCQYLDRMLLNDNTNPDTLQISNAGSPTQFNLLGYNPNAPNPADGLRAPVNSDNGDAIVGVISFGTFAVILKTRGLYYLYGQNSSNFQIQQVGGAVGCVAKDSIQVLNNGTILYQGTDGVYAFDGSTANKISHQLDTAMLGYNSLTLSQAQSQYINRRFWLNIGTDNWIFDQDANQGQGDWIYFAYGITALEFIQQNYGLYRGQSYAGTKAQLAIAVDPQPSSSPPPVPPCVMEVSWDPVPTNGELLENYSSWLKHPDSGPPPVGPNSSLTFQLATLDFIDNVEVDSPGYLYYFNSPPASADYDVLCSVRQAELSTYGGFQTYTGPTIRMSSTINTFYAALMTPNWNGGPTPTIAIWRCIAGTRLKISPSVAIPGSATIPWPWVNIWLSIRGSLITVYSTNATDASIGSPVWPGSDYQLLVQVSDPNITAKGFAGYADSPNTALQFRGLAGHEACL